MTPSTGKEQPTMDNEQIIRKAYQIAEDKDSEHGRWNPRTDRQPDGRALL
jgi:hypothetical protein